MTPGDQAKCDRAKHIFEDALAEIEALGVTVKLVHTEEHSPSSVYPRSIPPRSIKTFFHLNNVNAGDSVFEYEPHIPEGAVVR